LSLLIAKYQGLTRKLRSLFPALSFLIVIPSVTAQVSYVRPNSVEVGPFVGLTYGLDATRVLSGGNITYAVTKRILPYVEYSYFPPLLRTQLAPNGYQASTRVPVNDIHSGVHIRFPIRESPIVPYAVVGFGALLYPQRNITFSTVSSGQLPPPYPVPQQSAANFAANFGGGVRYYMGQRWGVRLEAKLYKPTGLYTTVFGKVEVGLFYQFR
jgi:hypothetical protein